MSDSIPKCPVIKVYRKMVHNSCLEKCMAHHNIDHKHSEMEGTFNVKLSKHK